MDREAWQATVHRFSKSWTRLKRLSKHPYLSTHHLSLCPPQKRSSSHRAHKFPTGILKAMGGGFSSVQSLSCVRLFATPWMAACQASLSITNFWSLLKLMPIELVMPSNHLILCCPLLLPPSIVPSIRVFSNESVLWIRWPKYWSFSFSIRGK